MNNRFTIVAALIAFVVLTVCITIPVMQNIKQQGELQQVCITSGGVWAKDTCAWSKGQGR